MSPGSVSRVVVADKVALVRRMLDGIRTLPLDDLSAFARDPRMVAAADSYRCHVRRPEIPRRSRDGRPGPITILLNWAGLKR